MGTPAWTLFPPKYVLRAAGDQATFANGQTNIVNLAFPIFPNEEWDVDVVLSCTMVLATGVKFYFTFPAGCVGDVHREGSVATLPTWQSLYLAALTVPGTFFITGAITGQYKLRARIINGANAGNIQLVGITGGATTTCAVKRGSILNATRIAP